MAALRTDKLSRKRKAKKSSVKRSAIAFCGNSTEWNTEGVTYVGSIAEWLKSSPEGDWYAPDLQQHSQYLDALFASSGWLIRHFEAGHTVIAMNVYPWHDGDTLDKLKPIFRVINASYLLAGKSLDEWHSLTGASSATVTAQLLETIEALENVIHSAFDANLAMTIPSTAMEAWKRCIPTGETYSRQHADTEALARAAFFGGWNYSKDNEIHEHGVYFDANSLYAFVMRRYGVPGGRAIATRDYQTGDIGIYSVRVSGLYVGMINPVSVRVGFEVVHPVCEDEKDSFVTEMTSVDIETCRAWNITIAVISGFRFDTMIYPFGEFVDKCEKLRHSSERGTALNAMARVLQASLFGKFGAASVNKEVMITNADLSTSGFTRADCVVSINAPDTNVSDIARWVRDVPSKSGTIQPVWAAFITAHARAYVLGALAVAGAENLLYAATDSLVLTQDGADKLLASEYCQDLSEYGQFKIVHRFLKFRSFAQNRYAGSAVTADGEYYVFGASSGLPVMPDTDYNALYASWLEPAITTDEQALRAAKQVFSIDTKQALGYAREVAKEERIKAVQAKFKANRLNQAARIAAEQAKRKIDRW